MTSTTTISRPTIYSTLRVVLATENVAGLWKGMTARCVAGCAMIPITVLKTRFESGQYNYTRMSTALLDIYRREGARGLCCGLVPTLVRDAPYSGLYLMFYTQLKQNASSLITGKNLNFDMKTNGYR